MMAKHSLEMVVTFCITKYAFHYKSSQTDVLCILEFGGNTHTTHTKENFLVDNEVPLQLADTNFS